MSDATLSLFGTEPGWLINPETKLERRFARWAKDNPDVLAEFERRALALHRAGQRRIGVKQVAEVIRYYAAVGAPGRAVQGEQLLHRAARALADLPEPRARGRD
jgi:hypothetical protein